MKSAAERLTELQNALLTIVSYPPKGSPRRTKDGYPEEFSYDEFAYRRMVDSYRDAIIDALKESHQLD
jgi:hypothetical protein